MAFTVIDADISWQDLAIAQEIAAAYNKRAAVCGANTLETRLGVASIDNNITVFDFVYAAQIGLESMATAFALNSTSLTGLSSYPAHFATLAAAFTAAGLTASGGWRRIADSGTQPAVWANYNAAGWAYGKITTKDLAGPWLWQDLMTMLTALTRVIINPGYPASRTNTRTYYFKSASTTPLPPGDPQDYPGTDLNPYFWLRSVTRTYTSTYLLDWCETQTVELRTISGIPSTSKSINLIVMAEGTSDYFWDTGLALNSTTIYQTWTANTAATVTADDIPWITTWSAAFYKDGNISHEGFLISLPRWVLDYNFAD